MGRPPQSNTTASRFTNAEFLWDDMALPGELGDNLIAHARMRNFNSLEFKGCTFANDKQQHSSSLAMGHGIDAFNSRFVVDNNCSPGTCPTVFRNLDHAVHATADRYRPFVVKNASFQNNICGIYASGVNGFRVTGNSLTMGAWDVELDNLDELYWGSFQRGIFSTGGSAFAIKDNMLLRTTGTTTQLEGIVVGYTRDHNDVMYRNQATGMDRGFIGEGISADVFGGQAQWVGLQMHCNTNTNNATNLMSRIADGAPTLEQNDHTIRGHQGGSLAAGNHFDQEASGLDFEISTTRLPVITYHYGTTTADQEPWYFTQLPGESELMPANVNSGPFQTALGGENACNQPAGIIAGPAELLSMLSTQRTAYGNTRYLHDQLIDGGSTDEVVLEITGAWPNDVWELRDYLLGLSPFLSEEALRGVVNKIGLPAAIKAEVIIANPDASQTMGFLRWAQYDALEPLPEYLIDAIVASWAGRTYRTLLEAQLAGQHEHMTRAVNGLVHHFGAPEKWSTDSLLWTWRQLRTNAARYSEAMLLADLGQYAAADSMLRAMPQERTLKPGEETERTRMISYVGLLAAADSAGRSSWQLDSAEVAQLSTLVGTYYDRPAIWAGNLLCAAYAKCRAPYTGGDATPKTATPGRVRKSSATAHSFTAHPNPASSYVVLSHLVPDNKGILNLVVRDLSGRQLKQFIATGEAGQTLWDTRGITPGVYTVELQQEGRALETTRVVVQP